MTNKIKTKENLRALKNKLAHIKLINNKTLNELLTINKLIKVLNQRMIELNIKL